MLKYTRALTSEEYNLMEHRFRMLDEDAPPVAAGLQPRDGVTYGCGDDGCRDCYELLPGVEEA